MAGDVEGGAGPVASILVLGWLRAYAAGRGLPEPVPNHGGLVLGRPGGARDARHVYAAPYEGLRTLAEMISAARVVLKACAGLTAE